MCNNTKEYSLLELEKIKLKFKKLHLTHESFKIVPMFSEFLRNFTFIFLCSQEKYRIYSINRPGRLLNFWTLIVFDFTTDN